jgi:hypothetical protein
MGESRLGGRWEVFGEDEDEDEEKRASKWRGKEVQRCISDLGNELGVEGGPRPSWSRGCRRQYYHWLPLE